MVEYLKQKVAEEDWHGVMDAAADLREIEAYDRGKKDQREQTTWIKSLGQSGTGDTVATVPYGSRRVQRDPEEQGSGTV